MKKALFRVRLFKFDRLLDPILVLCQWIWYPLLPEPRSFLRRTWSWACSTVWRLSTSTSWRSTRINPFSGLYDATTTEQIQISSSLTLNRNAFKSLKRRRRRRTFIDLSILITCVDGIPFLSMTTRRCKMILNVISCSCARWPIPDPIESRSFWLAWVFQLKC